MESKDFGVPAGVLQIEEFETHIDVRPTRTLDSRELSRVNWFVQKHGGKVAGVCEFGAWFTLPLQDNSESVEERWIEVSKMVPPPFLVRGVNEEAVEKIAASIKKTGRILEPLVVRPSPNQEGLFECVLGTQRLEAAKRCGWKRVRCNIYPSLSDQDCIEWQFIENEARRNLTDYERGRAMVELQEKFPKLYPTQEALGLRFGYTQDRISRFIRLYWLTERALEEKKNLSSIEIEQVKKIDEDVTRAIQSAPPDVQGEILIAAALNRASVREVEGMVVSHTVNKDPEETAMQKELERARNIMALDKAKKDALKRKLQRGYSEEMVQEVFEWCEEKNLPEKRMVDLFAPAVRLAWLNAMEEGKSKTFLAKAEATTKEPEAEKASS